jgi:predicted  nucleic acid-binding Zn-ribbon protein
LRAQIDSEIDAERVRLRAEGFAEEEIERRLALFEANKVAEFDSTLADFRAEQEAERARLEQDLANLEAEFSDSLQEANQELAQIQAAAEEREAELQRQFEEEQSRTEEELSQAEEQIRQLGAQRDQEISLTNQLNGFYTRVRDEIRTEQYDDALATLASLKSFLDSPTLLGNEAMVSRRPIDVFTADALEQLIEGERRSEQSLSFAETAQIVNDIQDLATRAAALVADGDEERATALYRQSFEQIPELAQGYEYLRSVDGLNTNDTQRAFNRSVVRALELGSTGSGSEAILAFEEALAVLPTQYQTSDFLAGYRGAVFSEDLNERIGEDTAGAAPLIAQADALVDTGAFLEAADLYEQALARYPLTNDRSQVAVAIRSIYSELSAEQARAAELAGEIVALRTQVDGLLALPAVHSETSAPLFDAAAAAMEEGRYQDAIEDYQEILSNYPQTDRRFEIISSLRTLSEAYEAEVARAAEDYAAIESQLTGAVSRLDAVERALTSLTSVRENLDRDDYELRSAREALNGFSREATDAGFNGLASGIRSVVERLFTRIDELRTQNDELALRNEDLQTELESSTASLSSDNEAIQAELDRLETDLATANETIEARESEINGLQTYRERIDALSAAYRDYRSLEDANRDAGQIRTRTYLQGFAQAVGADLYPQDPDDFIRRINDYNRSFEEAGVDEAFYGELVSPLQDVQAVLFDPNYAETIDAQLADFATRAEEAESSGEGQRAELYRTYEGFLEELKLFLEDFNELVGF